MKSQAYLLAALAVVQLSGCSSKFSEKAPSSSSVEQMPLSERVEQKDRLDAKLAQIETLGQRVKYLVSLFKQIHPSSDSATMYTPIDFFIDLTTQLEEPLPQKKGSKYISKSNIQLPIKELSDECRMAEVILTTDPIGPESATAPVVPALNYGIKTCGTNNQYVQVFSVDLLSDGPNLIFDTAKVIQVLRATLATSKAPNMARLIGAENLPLTYQSGNTSCISVVTHENIVHDVRCNNLSIALSPTENAVFSEILFSSEGPIRLSVNANIVQNGQVKAEAHFQMDHEGHVSRANLQKVSPPPETSAPAPESGADTAPAPIASTEAK